MSYPPQGAPAATKELWVAGDSYLGTNATREVLGFHPMFALPDAVSATYVNFGFRVPNDFSAMLANYPKLVLYATVAGDIRLVINANWGKVGEARNTHWDLIDEYTQAIIANQFNEIDISAAFNAAAIEPGDQFGIRVYRDSDDVLDTLAGPLYVFGIVVRYS